MKWPDKDKRENLEINGFIKAYARLPDARRLEIVQKGEKPDYVVRDVGTGTELGVELTSIYMDNRSVPDVHMQETESLVDIPDDKKELDRYLKRLIAALIEKICKARKGYSTEMPLILSVYINEYISIYLGKEEWKEFTQRYEGVFDSMAPFSEIVFWNLSNGGVFQVKPS